MFDIIVYIAFMLWGISEYIIIAGKRVEQNKQIKDINSKIQNLFIIITLPLGITFGILDSQFKILEFPFNVIFWKSTGLVLLVSGVVIRRISINTLKNYFSSNITIQKDHKLVTAGIYKYIRHPSYLGANLCFLGFGLVFANLISFTLIFIVNFIISLNRISFEEKILSGNFGKDYENYRKNSRKLIPGIF